MEPAASRRSKLVSTIALAGLCAGALDIADAFLFFGLHGATPTRILQGIAYALIDKSAYAMGLNSALLGLLLHFFIATCFAAAYIIASRRLPLHRRPILYGAIYGLLIYVVMNYLVLPLSHIGPRPVPAPPALINGIAALVFCVGIPITLIARRIRPSTTQ
jgi:uncharacterized membrane protein YagU involved in acid resistance